MSGTLNNSQNLSENSSFTQSNCGTICSEDEESEVKVLMLNLTTQFLDTIYL